MINATRLTAMIEEKQHQKEAEEAMLKLYNEALEYKICPGCGAHNTLVFKTAPNNGSVGCPACGLQAQWHSTRMQYTNFKEG